MPAKTIIKRMNEPTIPPDNIMITGSLINKNSNAHKRGAIQATMARYFFLSFMSEKFIQPRAPKMSGNSLAHAAREANSVENKTKKAPIK